MVRPEDAVTDFRTAITGHTAADLEGIEYSRGSAQQDLLRHLVGQVTSVPPALLGPPTRTPPVPILRASSTAYTHLHTICHRQYLHVQ